MEIAATISSFLTHVRVEKGLSSNTVSAYRRDLVKFDEFARKRKLMLEAVSRDDLVDFLAGLYRQKLESKTVARSEERRVGKECRSRRSTDSYRKKKTVTLILSRGTYK